MIKKEENGQNIINDQNKQKLAEEIRKRISEKLEQSELNKKVISEQLGIGQSKEKNDERQRLQSLSSEELETINLENLKKEAGNSSYDRSVLSSARSLQERKRNEEEQKIQERARMQAQKRIKEISQKTKKVIKKRSKQIAKIRAKRMAAAKAKKVAVKAAKQAAAQMARMVIAEILAIIASIIAALGWWIVVIIIVVVVIVALMS
jgi:cobalamin biosynthesis Mg chelatase CobN